MNTDSCSEAGLTGPDRIGVLPSGNCGHPSRLGFPGLKSSCASPRTCHPAMAEVRAAGLACSRTSKFDQDGCGIDRHPLMPVLIQHALPHAWGYFGPFGVKE